MLLLPVLFTGCYAYKAFPKTYRTATTPAPTLTVYVVNPGLKKEYEILKNAGIYRFSNDSTISPRVRLYPMLQHKVCGQPLLGSMITLGQLPVYLPDTYQFKYEEEVEGNTRLFQYELKIAQRYWFWDIFTFQKDLKKAAGKALAGNYYEVPAVKQAQ